MPKQESVGKWNAGVLARDRSSRVSHRMEVSLASCGRNPRQREPELTDDDDDDDRVRETVLDFRFYGSMNID